MNVQKLSREDQIFGGVGLLLAIDLLFLPWFSVSFGPISVTSTATGAPDGWLGVLAVLATIAAVADLAIERFSPGTQLPAIGGGRSQTRFVLSCIAAGLVVLKFLFHVHFSLFGFGFWGAVILTAGFVYLATKARAGSAVPVGALG